MKVAAIKTLWILLTTISKPHFEQTPTCDPFLLIRSHIGKNPTEPTLFGMIDEANDSLDFVEIG